jgi:hypothetical protein
LTSLKEFLPQDTIGHAEASHPFLRLVCIRLLADPVG